MINKEKLQYIIFLYNNVFEDNADNSEELRTFVQNNKPQPLRIKVEELSTILNKELVDNLYNYGSINLKNIVDKVMYLRELDTIITSYAENDNT